MLRFEHQTLLIPGLTKEYRFLHLTDAHVVLWDENEDPIRAEYAGPRIPMFAVDGVPSYERFNEAIAWANGHADQFNGVILTGDIIDFPSAPCMEYLEKALASLKIPYVYTLGNHDWSYFNDYHTPHAIVANRPRFTSWCGGNTFISKTRFGELTVIGLDDTMSQFEDGVAETLAEAMAGEKHVILVQHIPHCVDTLHDDTVAKWKSDINIGESGCNRNDNWKKILELITGETSPVRAVVAGHLHMQHLDLIAGKIPQYLTAATAYGFGTVLTVTGA